MANVVYVVGMSSTKLKGSLSGSDPEPEGIESLQLRVFAGFGLVSQGTFSSAMET